MVWVKGPTRGWHSIRAKCGSLVSACTSDAQWRVASACSGSPVSVPPPPPLCSAVSWKQPPPRGGSGTGREGVPDPGDCCDMTNKLQADNVSKTYWSLLCRLDLPSVPPRGGLASQAAWGPGGRSTGPRTDLQAQPAISLAA